MNSVTWNDGGQGCFATISMRETGNKMRYFCCGPCCASAKMIMKCCHILKAMPLPSALLFWSDSTPLQPLTFNLTLSCEQPWPYFYLFIYSWVLVIGLFGYSVQWMVSTEPPCHLVPLYEFSPTPHHHHTANIVAYIYSMLPCHHMHICIWWCV